MSPLHHHAKELAERLCGRHLIFSRRFPFVKTERRFLTVRLDLHNKCNIRCRMCYFALDEVWQAPRVELSEAVLGRLEREVWPRTRELWLSCATEPLIGNKLERVLPRAKAAGVPLVQLVTNGMALSEARARTLVEGGLDRLSVSLDGATAETYEAIRTLASFERVVGNVRRFKEIRDAAGTGTPALTIRAVMMTRNLGEWAALVRLAAGLGADRVVLQPQTYYTEFGAKDPLWEHRAEVDAALTQARAAARECGVELEAPSGFGGEAAEGCVRCDGNDGKNENDENHGTDSAFRIPRSALQSADDGESGRDVRAPSHCLSPWLNIMVYPDGEVTPCFQLFGHQRFGNLERESFNQIFYGDGFSRLREELRTGRLGEICRTCAAGKLEESLGEDAAEKLQRQIFPEQ